MTCLKGIFPSLIAGAGMKLFMRELSLHAEVCRFVAQAKKLRSRAPENLRNSKDRGNFSNETGTGNVAA